MAYSFIPARTFFNEGVQSWYIDGLTYTVRDDNLHLHTLAQKWFADGDIRMLARAAPTSQVSGCGVVETH